MPAFGPFVRARLRWLSIVQIVALLFVQFAIAAHGCPALAAERVVPVADCAAHGGTADAPASTPLCKPHCVADDQAVGPHTGVDVPAAPVLLAVLDWRDALATAPAPPNNGNGRLSGAPPPGAAPPYLRLRVLRQ